MKASQITLSEAAVADILEQAEWYEAQADQKLAKRWEKAVTSTLLRISRGHALDRRVTLAPPNYVALVACRSQAFLNTSSSISHPRIRLLFCESCTGRATLKVCSPSSILTAACP